MKDKFAGVLLATLQYEHKFFYKHDSHEINQFYSWAVLKLLTSVHAGKIDDLSKNGKSCNIEFYFFMEKQTI